MSRNMPSKSRPERARNSLNTDRSRTTGRAAARGRKRFRKGDRVEYTGLPGLGPALHSHGSVAEVCGAQGASIHPDPAQLLTYVLWDDGHGEGVFTGHLSRLRK